MRYQDRLLSLLPGKHPHVTRYVARELEGLFPHFDSDRIVTALRAEAGAHDPAAALQAAASLVRYLPTHLQACYVPESWPAGPRLSRAMSMASLEAARKDAGDGTPRSEALARSAVHLLHPAIVALADLLPRLQATSRQAAFRLMAELPHGASADVSSKALAKDGAEAGPMALLAMAASCRAGREGELIKMARHLDGTWLYPAAISAMAFAPFDAVHQFLVAQAPRASAEALPSFAVALESFGSFGVLKPLGSLAGRGNGWTALQVLQTLARLRDEKALDVIETVFWRQEHQSVREAAVRAAGAIRTERSAGFLRTVLSRELPPTVAARALQALQAAGSDAEALARLAAPHLRSHDPELAVAAVLASLAGAESAAVKSMKALVGSGEPSLRKQGAYCLGYYQGRASLELLALLARKDPEVVVRRQAIASMACYETNQTLRDILLALVREPDVETLPVLAAVLSRADISEDAAMAEALVAAAERLDGKPEARHLYVPLGRVAQRSASGYLTDKLQMKQDPEDVSNLLQAVDLRGPGALRAVQEAAGHADPRVRALAAVALWNQGETSGVDLLQGLLGDKTRRESLAAALDGLERIAVTAIKLSHFERFRQLAARLRQNLETPGYRSFSTSELSLSVPRDAAAPAYDPNASLAEKSGWREADEAGLAKQVALSPDASVVIRPSRIVRAADAPVFATGGLDAPRPDPRLMQYLLWAAGGIAAAVILIAVLGVLRLGVAALHGPAARPGAVVPSGP